MLNIHSLQFYYNFIPTVLLSTLYKVNLRVYSIKCNLNKKQWKLKQQRFLASGTLKMNKLTERYAGLKDPCCNPAQIYSTSMYSTQ